MNKKITESREFMKSNINVLAGIKTDQQKLMDSPPVQKIYKKSRKIIKLPEPDKSIQIKSNLYDLIKNRRSVRKYSEDSLSLNELSFLLWATQGIRRFSRKYNITFRTVPSAGSRHPFETFLAINKVIGLEKGFYQYLPLSHDLIFYHKPENMQNRIVEATLQQKFIGKGALVFFWCCIPYRGEWRYHIMAHKLMVLDAGHICQNLYLACEAINCGTCAIAAYDQNKVDELLKLNGDNEFVVYLAPVGKKYNNN